MTLLAAFRCEIGGHPGVVICADSQETCGDYRIEVKKLEAKHLGNYELIRCGAGNTSELIDGQIRAIEQNIPHWPAALNEEQIRLKLENLLLAFNSRQVKDFPALPDDKLLKFILCLRDKQSSHIYLWKSTGTVILPVERYALLGWEESVYDYEVKRLCQLNLNASQAVLLGVHLFSVAQNSLYISRPTQVIAVHRNGVHVEAQRLITALEERLTNYDKALAQLFLACPDTSLHRDEFSSLFANFKTYVMELREHYHGMAIGSELGRVLSDPDWKPNPISQLPPDTIVERVMEEGRPVLNFKATFSEPEE